MTRQRLDLDEVRRRVPTLELIENEEIRSSVEAITARAPEYFWRVPASTSGFHHPLCRVERGLWRHMLMLSTVIEHLSDSLLELGQIDPIEVDHAHGAAILHDQQKKGVPERETSVSNHDILMQNEVYYSGEIPSKHRKPIADAIGSHMGPWYDGPEPETPLEQLVHTADMISATETITPGIQGPIPDEIQHPELEEVDLR